MQENISNFTEALAGHGVCNIQENYPLSRICTFRIGGEAKIILTPESAKELIFCIQALRELRIPYLTVGSASNLLFDDRGFDGAVIRTNKIKTVTVENGILTAEAGVPLPSLCRIASENSMGGLHGLCGIPGTVGGSIITAAGAFGCNIYDHITEVKAYFPDEKQVRTLPITASDFSYRKSPKILKDAVILRVSFRLPGEDRRQIEEKMTHCTEQRRATQPHGIPTAGSYFKRPKNAPPAALLIDQAGLKGLTVGGASVSEKHAGFIVNSGSATAEDVKRLAQAVKNTVLHRFGVTLTEEVQAVPYQL